MKKALLVRPSRMKPGYLDAYEEALRKAEIEPVVVAPEEAVSLDGVDGLLLIGGTDVNPGLYGEAAVAETDAPDDARDKAEMTALEDALKRDMPVLAICRGMQMLNVQHGGTLVQHLQTTEHHQVQEPDHSRSTHSVEVDPASSLARITDAGPAIPVNSRHHQAVDRLGSGLRIAARDPEDGTIEAIERPDRRFVVGVQWHPEDQAAERDDQARLFRAFADAME